MSKDSSTSDTQGGWSPTSLVGRRIDRFTIMGEIGRGGWGVVYEATDPLTEAPVALKLIAALSPAGRDRVAREITALTFAADPGVVPLLGHGRAPEGVWIAMELIRGVPFPGGTWEKIAPRALALVETIARVHQLGLIHRDLKPENVLVREDGRPVVLDLGLAAGELLGAPLTREGAVLGTPRYQAPEQLEGRRVDDRADIYALGVMLYEALSGRLPHQADDVQGLRSARALQTPAPLEQMAPSVPAMVADLVRCMLARAPEDRPSAEAVALALSGRPLPSEARLPRLDGDALPTRILDQLSRGASVDVWGPRRSGKTRLLEDIARRSPAAARAAPAERPYASLRSVTGTLPERPLDEVEALVRRALMALPGPLLVDDWETMDAWTRALLPLVQLPHGQLRVREVPGATLLTPLDERALSAIFEGPERVLHLSSDAGALLAKRTGGWPGRVVDLLARWARQGRVQQREARFRVDRDTLDALIEETESSIPLERVARDLSAEQEDVLLATRIAWPRANVDLVAAVLGRPRWEIEAQVATLAARGCLAEEATGLRPRVEPTRCWTSERIQAAHGVVAARLPVGAEGRLAHLLATQDPAHLAVEIRARVDHLITRGQVRRAIPLLWSLRAVVPDQSEVADRLVGLLLEQRTVGDLEQASFVAGAGRPDLRLLVEATRLARQTDPEGVEARLDAVPSWRDPELAMIAHSARFEAARRRPTEEQETLLRHLEQDEVVRGSPGRQARWQNWLGILRFRQRRFDDAARIHEDAAPRRVTEVERLTSLANAVRAWIAADDLDRAEALAAEVCEVASERRLHNLEAQAAWLLRAIANRRRCTQPDLDLPAIIRLLGDGVLTAQAYATEAYIAWRGGAPQGRELAMKAARAFRAAGMPHGGLHATVLAWTFAPEGDPGPMVAALLGLPEPAITLDGLALLARAGARLRVPRATLEARIHAQGPWRSPYPYDAFSVEEAIREIHLALEPV